MAHIKARDLREKTDQELQDQMGLEKKRLFDATVKGASGEAIKPHEKREGKRLIARIQTILRERALRRTWAGRLEQAQAKVPAGDAAGQRLAAAEAKPHLGRVTAARLARRGTALTPGVRAALKVAEAKRRLACLKRQDEGETR